MTTDLQLDWTAHRIAGIAGIAGIARIRAAPDSYTTRTATTTESRTIDTQE